MLQIAQQNLQLLRFPSKIYFSMSGNEKIPKIPFWGQKVTERPPKFAPATLVVFKGPLGLITIYRI